MVSFAQMATKMPEKGRSKLLERFEVGNRSPEEYTGSIINNISTPRPPGIYGTVQ
jgi:hypothetical protein